MTTEIEAMVSLLSSWTVSGLSGQKWKEDVMNGNMPALLDLEYKFNIPKLKKISTN